MTIQNSREQTSQRRLRDTPPGPGGGRRAHRWADIQGESAGRELQLLHVVHIDPAPSDGVAASAFSSRRRDHGRGPLVVHGYGSPDFRAINARTLAILPVLVARWLPGGRRVGNEYLARNPRRHDRQPGSFSINLATGRWADFATGDKGGDTVSLVAYLFGLSQGEAARKLAAMLGLAVRP